MEWMILFQNQNNRIVFVSSINSEERDSMMYYKFFEFVTNEFNLKNFVEFREAIDRFKVIYLIKDGSWEIVQEDSGKPSFAAMWQINGDSNIEQEQTATEKLVDKSKGWLDSIFDHRKKNNLGFNKTIIKK